MHCRISQTLFCSIWRRCVALKCDLARRTPVSQIMTEFERLNLQNRLVGQQCRAGSYPALFCRTTLRRACQRQVNVQTLLAIRTPWAQRWSRAAKAASSIWRRIWRSSRFPIWQTYAAAKSVRSSFQRGANIELRGAAFGDGRLSRSDRD